MIKIEKKWLENMTLIDLFAGLGGFRLALESLGAKCVYSNEWDKLYNALNEFSAMLASIWIKGSKSRKFAA